MTPSKQAERSIYEAIRLETIANGFLPDITAAVNEAEWQAARTALIATLTKPSGIVDILGVGSPEGRNESLLNRIVIDRESSVPGTIGGAPSVRFNATTGVDGEAGTKFEKVTLPTLSEDVTYEITLISNHIFMDRVMRGIVKNVLKNRYYLPTYDADTGVLDGNATYLEFLSEVDKTVGKNIVRSLRYTAFDIVDENDVSLKTGIASMDTITFQTAVTENTVDLAALNPQGNWDADTNTPTLLDSTGTKDDYYAVSVPGTQDLESGDITWAVNDIVYHDGIKWLKLNT